MALVTSLDSDDLVQGRLDQTPTCWFGFSTGPRPGKYTVYAQDFTNYVAADQTITLVNSSTPALSTTEVGVLNAVNTGAANDSINSQLVAPVAIATAGKGVFYECRFKVDDATNSIFRVGLSTTNTAMATSLADALVFAKDAATTSVVFITANNSVIATTPSILTCDTAYHKYGFHLVGTDVCYVFVDDVLKATVNTPVRAAQALRSSYQIKNGTAAARTMNIDAVFAGMER